MEKTISNLLSWSINRDISATRTKGSLRSSLLTKMRSSISSQLTPPTNWRRLNKPIWLTFWNNNTTLKSWRICSFRNSWPRKSWTSIKRSCIKPSKISDSGSEWAQWKAKFKEICFISESLQVFVLNFLSYNIYIQFHFKIIHNPGFVGHTYPEYFSFFFHIVQ